MEKELKGPISFDSIEEGFVDHVIPMDDGNDLHVFNEDKSEGLINKSINLKADSHSTLPTQNPLKAYSFMLIAVLGITLNHLSAKIAFYRNPKLTNYDTILFIGLAVFPIYFVAGKVAGINMSVSQYNKKATVLIILSILCSLLVNF